MNLGFATDVGNPNFQGAANPDAGLFVEFFWYEPVDGWATMVKSKEAGRKMEVKREKQAFVRIMVPGDKTTEAVQAVKEEHKQRFPQQWMAWQMAEGLLGDMADVPGWKITEWEELSADQVRELTFMRFSTVEQIAGASDKQIQGVGMGGVSLREKARVELRNKMGAETKAEIEKRDALIAEQSKRIMAMEETVGKLLAKEMGRGGNRVGGPQPKFEPNQD